MCSMESMSDRTPPTFSEIHDGPGNGDSAMSVILLAIVCVVAADPLPVTPFEAPKFGVKTAIPVA